MTGKLYLLLVSFFIYSVGFTQVPSFKTSIDRSSIIIGQQFHLKLEVNIPHNTFTLQSLSIPDSIPHFEIVGKGHSDSSSSGDETYFSQVLNITSFDSGTFVLPQFKVNFLSIDKSRQFSGLTDTFRINVGYSPLDSIKPFHDIHTVLGVTNEWELWKWLALLDALLLLVALILLIIKIIRKKKNVEVFASKLSPYEEAIKGLTELSTGSLLREGQVKKFHTELVSIFKRFMSRKAGKDLTSLTSGELLVRMNQSGFNQEEILRIASTLRMSDAVKFAKFVPSNNMSETALADTRSVIDAINSSNQNAISK